MPIAPCSRVFRK